MLKFACPKFSILAQSEVLENGKISVISD